MIDAYLEGDVVRAARKAADDRLGKLATLEPEEAAVLVLLRRRLADEEQHSV